MSFDLDKTSRQTILNNLLEKLEGYYSDTKNLPITPNLNIKKIRKFIEKSDLESGGNYEEAIERVTNGLKAYAVHTPHPKYFGLFNPRSNFAGILADLITATYNPQLAAWSHAPYAAEIEAKLIHEFAIKFGYRSTHHDGVFTTGGAEANLTALLCALNNKYPNFAKDGLFSITQRPLIYCSEEAHHSVQKAAKVVGLGYDSVKTIPVNDKLQLDTALLKKELKKAKKTNSTPLMIVGTAGTTGAGYIDDLKKLSKVARKNKLWFHVDAAYGGAAILSNKLKKQLKGIELSDSITFDAHKWMSVPMGTSIFLTSNPTILGKTFRITTEYMPKEANTMEIIDPFTHSIQWSRRFIGLKVYLSLLFYGWKGYEKVINHQAEMGGLLRRKLLENNWVIKNKTKFPIICFTDSQFEKDPHFTQAILNKVIANGKSWLSLYPIQNIPIFRACITNYNTTEIEINELIEELNLERSNYLRA